MRLLLAAAASLTLLLAPPAHAVVGGTPLDVAADAPWLVKAGPCSGTLVAPDLVVTAAHCADGTPLAQLAARPAAGGPAVPAVALTVHPSYGLAPTPHHDVAAIGLAAAPAGTAVLPVAGGPPAAATPVWVAGWGATDVAGTERKPVFGPRAADPLRGALAALDRTTCTRWYAGHKPRTPLDASMVCARDPLEPAGLGRAVAPCLGDSGGALVAPGPVLAGVFSWTHRCGDEGDPSVFTGAGAVRAVVARASRRPGSARARGAASSRGRRAARRPGATRRGARGRAAAR
ncbi:trypsin-like serine protease [Conexibacter sp. SYSU D00693]|uniref:trypsin-like serine protease n=1 Tax=Conexibacter sp. SYSU D00693 TaxID=2812560 RepID=UPI00196AF079|nr:trypsin-like serine protease [Conexibacter sp. SYSU D00693]